MKAPVLAGMARRPNEIRFSPGKGAPPPAKSPRIDFHHEQYQTVKGQKVSGAEFHIEQTSPSPKTKATLQPDEEIYYIARPDPNNFGLIL